MKSKCLVSIERDEVQSYSGDVLVVPCDVILSYKKISNLHSQLLEENPRLETELRAIGGIELGHAVTTLGNNKIKRLIYLPYCDTNNLEFINPGSLHQALRSVFDLAELYKCKSLAIPLSHISCEDIQYSKPGIKNLFGVFEETKKVVLNQQELEDIVLAVGNHSYKTLEKIYLYK